MPPPRADVASRQVQADPDAAHARPGIEDLSLLSAGIALKIADEVYPLDGFEADSNEMSFTVKHFRAIRAQERTRINITLDQPSVELTDDHLLSGR